MATVVDTEFGKVQGIEKHNLTIFRGIPFATPPIGRLRFKAPQSPQKWSGILNTTEFSPGAIQPKLSFFGVSKTDEDCLYLNVTTPNTDDKKRPVMVWIHGGAFVSGAASQSVYNPNLLVAKHNAVVVTINYRLGALGFAYLKNSVTDSTQVDSNLGLRDQIAALKWIRNNIENFGGDKNNITLFGESAGGMSIGCLMASPLANGLFHKAIIQSGSADQVMSAEDGTKVASHWLQAMDTSADDLWQQPAEKLLKAQNKCFTMTVSRGKHQHNIPQFGMPFFPVIDGDVLPEAPMEAIAKGCAKDIPLLIGTTSEEWNFFLLAPGTEGKTPREKMQSLDESELARVFDRNLPGLGEQALAHYLAFGYLKDKSSAYQPADTFVQFESDRLFRIPSIRLAEIQSQFQSNTYMYQLNWDKGVWGACHASDIPFVFGGVTSNFGQFLTGGGDKAEELHQVISEAWSTFAKTGHPNTKALTQWLAYDTNTRITQIFDERCRIEKDPLSKQREFWTDIL